MTITPQKLTLMSPATQERAPQPQNPATQKRVHHKTQSLSCSALHNHTPTDSALPRPALAESTWAIPAGPPRRSPRMSLPPLALS